jgi:hypothetical protein
MMSGDSASVAIGVRRASASVRGTIYDDDASVYASEAGGAVGGYDDDASRYSLDDAESRYRYSVWSAKTRQSVLDDENSAAARERFVKRVQGMIARGEGNGAAAANGRGAAAIPPVPRLDPALARARNFSPGTGMAIGERF